MKYTERNLVIKELIKDFEKVSEKILKNTKTFQF